MYNSDITDKEWEILAPFVAQGSMGRPRKHEIRNIINAIRYVMKRGGAKLLDSLAAYLRIKSYV